MVARSAAAALLRVLAGSAGSCTTLGVGPTGTEPFGGSHLLPLLSCLLLAAAVTAEAAAGEQGSSGGWSRIGRRLEHGRAVRRTASRGLTARSGELCLLAAAATATTEEAAAQLRRLKHLVPAVADALAKLRTPSSFPVCSNASVLPT